MTDPDVFEWQLADVLTNESALFILWAIKTLFCTRRADFLREYAFDPQELDSLLEQLRITNFLQDDGTELVLTNAGNLAVAQLDTAPAAPATHNLARPATDIEARFNVPKEHLYVEKRLMGQLQALGWSHGGRHSHELVRDPETPSYVQTEGRKSYRDVLLKKSLKRAIYRLNQDKGMPAPTEEQCEEVIRELSLVQPAGSGLIEANQRAMKLLLEGVDASNPPGAPGGAYRRLRLIDTDDPHNNEFLALNQFRIQLPGEERFIIPDIVLFVNGIPLVVIECKSPEVTDPIESAVVQMRRYADAREGVPALFHFNLFLVATCYYTAKAGALGAGSQDYQQWKDPVAPYPSLQNAAPLLAPYPLLQNAAPGDLDSADAPSSQQLLVEGMLSKENLIDLLKNFVIFDSRSVPTIKIIPRYQQYRAVQKALQRLDTGKVKTLQNDDKRGGIIWHTQGSGKSLTMVFLIRKMRTLKRLKDFKIVVVTDRQDLQDQLKSTMKLTGDALRVARDIPHAQTLLMQQKDDINFITIQKMRGEEDEEDVPTFTERNPSPNILLIVDEAHRSHTSRLHGNILLALPNCAKIGFTGTPIMLGDRPQTTQIFGEFIDKYTILESEQDGATLPILYEGYEAYAIVEQEQQLDQAYDYLTRAMPAEVKRRIVNLYAGEEQVLEAPELIEAKARHMLLHYAANVLPNGFKAMVVASSRLATIKYQHALMQAKGELLATLDTLDPQLLAYDEEKRKELSPGMQMLLQAYAQRELLQALECAAVISSLKGDDPAWSEWSDETKRKRYIARFKLPQQSRNGNEIGRAHV